MPEVVAPGKPTPCGCFPGDTGVATPHGLIAIASLRVGDQVLAENPSEWEGRAGEASGADRRRYQAANEGGPLRRQQPQGDDQPSVLCGQRAGYRRPQLGTGGRPQVGDRLRTEDGRHVMVVSLRYHTGFAHVYTLTIATDHDFFVGAAGVFVLVHNCPLSLPPGPSQQATNKLTGDAFEDAVADALHQPLNTTKVQGKTAQGNIINTEPDLLGGNVGVADIKNVKDLKYTTQLQAQADYATTTGQAFSIIIGPGTRTISVSLQRVVQLTGGIIVRFDPSTGSFSNVAFDTKYRNRVLP